MSRSYQRPENALKRAQEFIDVGKQNKALDVLYEVIKKSKMRPNYSEKVLMPIMRKFVELCVQQKKSHFAKEGLYQFRNIFQNTNVMAVENAVRLLLQLADERTELARVESHQAVVDVEDLDCPRTSEEIMLSAVSGEDAQDRSDRTILTPWVKFLWEVYRHCLDLLRINAKVERLYHDIARHALRFCEKYVRRTEFRKLTENLRNHLANIQKQQGSSTTAVNLNNPDTQQLNLETRLEQLNVAIRMELWQEAYKAIEDISDLMMKSKKMPKPHVMASYYQKLALVFWKAGNLLFHAAALFKLFQLLRDQKKNITPEELCKRASTVLVATLAIPLPSAHPEFDRFIETEKSALEKIDKLAFLLNIPKPPTRVSLIKDLSRLNIVSHVHPELRNLYTLMEHDFEPLELCTMMQSHFDWINGRPESGLPQYVVPLQAMIICRLIKQVAQIYQTITTERLLELAVFVDRKRLERVLVDLVRHNDLQIRIDHRSSCIHFGGDLSESQREDLPEGPFLQPLPSETIRCQLVQMSSAAKKCISLIMPDIKRKEMEPIRAQTIQLYEQTRRNDHQRLLQRQQIIEERKELLETQNLEREELQRRQMEEQQKRQKEEEQERLRREANKREKERHEEQIKQIQTKQIKEKLLQISKTTYGAKMIEKIDKEELLLLGPEEILQRQVEELEKERKEQQKKLKAQEKLVDHFERAKRLIEIPKLRKHLDKQKDEDKEFWQATEKERVKRSVEEHELAYHTSVRLAKMIIDKDAFIEQLKAKRRSEITKKMDEYTDRLNSERQIRLAERKETRKTERKNAYYRQKAEEEQQRKDEELKKQREEEEQLEQERMQREEEERDNRRIEQENQRNASETKSDDPKSAIWRRSKVAASRVKEQEKVDAWRVKEAEPDVWRAQQPEREEKTESRFISRDIRRDEPRDENRRDKRDEPSRDSFRKSDWADRAKDDGSSKDSWRGGSSRLRDDPEKENRRDDGREMRRNDDRDRRDYRSDDRREHNFDERRGGDRRDNERSYDNRGGKSSWRTDDADGRGDKTKNGDADSWRGSGASSRFRERDQDRDNSTAEDGDRRDMRRGDDRKDIRRNEDRRDFRRDDDRRDFRRDDDRRDFRRDDDRRDFRRDDDRRDIRRGDGDNRDFRRGDGDNRDFRRGDGDNRDFRRADGDTRDFRRGDRDIRRGDGYNKDIRRGDDDRREIRRGGDGEKREFRRADDDRDMRKSDNPRKDNRREDDGGRRDRKDPPRNPRSQKEEPKKEAKKPPKQADAEGWTTVGN